MKFATMADQGNKILRAATPVQTIPYGPWRGSMRSRPADQVPRDFLSGGSNFLYLPRTGYWRRRGGTVEKFDTFGAEVGLLPAKWGAKARWTDEFLSEAISDGVPTLMTLATKETVVLGLDDGRFSQVWLRDQVNNLNYTLGDEFSDATYPEPGAVQSYRIVPLWYDSGDGGITRGVSEFARRFFFCGSRRFLKVGNWWYFPSVLGTPSRWNGGKAVPDSAIAEATATSDIGQFFTNGSPACTLNGAPDAGPCGLFTWGINRGGGSGYSTAWQSLAVDNSPTDSDFIFVNNASNVNEPFTAKLGFPTISSTVVNWRVKLVAKLTGAYAGGATLIAGITRSDGRRYDSAPLSISTLTPGSYATLNFDIVCSGSSVGDTANSVRFHFDLPGAESFSPGFYVTKLSILPTPGQGVAAANRLIPSGPLPPTHAGTLEKGAAIAVDAETRIFPDADLTDGTWTTVGGPTDLYDCINSPSSEADYISTNASGGTFCEISIANPAFTPASGEAVTFTIRLRRGSLGSNGTVTAELREGATVRFSAGSITPTLAWIYYSFTLSAAQVASIANWVTADLRLRLTPAGSIGTIQCAEQYITITPSGVASAGGWLGSDRFFYSVAYRFEDDSVWMPCLPRFPNDLLLNGFNLFTVDAGNPTTRYDKVIWRYRPVGVHGVKSHVLLRSPKIDSTISDNLQINPYDLRIVAEIPDNEGGDYEDYFANDDSLTQDVARAFIRFDHIMPPRARHIFGGDLRVCHSYGGQNPCAIILAPVGRTADYDLNDHDGATALYTEDGSYFIVTLGDGGQFLNLSQTNGTTVIDTLQLDFSVYDTLQKLVDRINATSIAANGQQWRAQLCPGVNPEASTVDALTPNVRAVSACETTSGVAEIRRTAGGLGRVAVGAVISAASAQFPAGTYITRIDSDTKLITSANAIATSSATNYFYFELGDSPTVATADTGYQRVIANSLPGFLYFSKDYLDNEPLDKQAVWMTVASPGQVKSAANNFSGRTANKHTPPIDSGISMGGVAVDQGFVVGFANKVGAIRNTRDSGSGLDEEYRLEMFNESRGVIGPMVPGNRVAFYPTPEGISAADLFRELQLSEHIFVHAPEARGDFTYEAPLSLAAAAIDNDTGYFHLRVMRSALWVNYRASGSHPNRQVVYDFSTGEAAGLEGLIRGPSERWPGTLYGWSKPLLRSVTEMAEARRSDGSHLYGWNDQNIGSVGDGRVDELEVGDTDNGTAIAAEAQLPWVPSSEETDDLISGQEMIVEHSSPDGSTGTLEFHRSLSDVVSVLQLGTSAEVVRSELKQLPQTARAATQRCYLGYKQATGPARELRSMKFKAKLVPRYRPT